MAELEEALEIIGRHPDKSDFVGPRAESLIQESERALGLSFPPTFRRFLSELGAGGFGAEEFYGLIHKDFGRPVPPNGIGLTLWLRESDSLPTVYIVVYEDGMGGYFILDTSRLDDEGESPLYVWEAGGSTPGAELEYISPDFGNFVLDCVRSQVS